MIINFDFTFLSSTVLPEFDDNLKFDLLADEDKTSLKAYKAWAKKKFMGREFMGTVRSTYLIDKKGKVLKTWTNVKVKDQTMLKKF